MSKVYNIEDSANALQFIDDNYCNNQWRYGQRSNVNTSYDQGHWKVDIGLGSPRPLIYDHSKMPFIDRHPAVKLLWEQLKGILEPDSILVRAYINGYTYGTDGYAHRDDPWINERYGPDTLSETCIFYLNPEWHHDWGGETVVFNDEYDIENSILPKPNRLFVFDSNKLHAARPISRCCTEVRRILVMKTANKIVNEKKVDFIRKNYTNDNEFARLYDIAVGVRLNDLSDSTVQAAMYVDIYKDKKASKSVIDELLGEYCGEIISLYHDLHHKKDSLIKELKASSSITDTIKRDLAFLHYSVLYEDKGDTKQLKELSDIVQKIEEPDA